MSGHEQPGCAGARWGLQKYHWDHARQVAPQGRCTPGCPQPSHIPSPQQDTGVQLLGPFLGTIGSAPAT